MAERARSGVWFLERGARTAGRSTRDAQNHCFFARISVRQGARKRFGAIGQGVASGLSVRHDHGGQYMAHDFQAKITWLGAASSPACIRAPEGNGSADRLIHTLHENLLWVRTSFKTVEELWLTLIEFNQTYNATWLTLRQGHRSPLQFSCDQMDNQALVA